MNEAVQTLEGWYVLHQFLSVDWPSWRVLPAKERAAAVAEFTALTREFAEDEDERKGAYGQYQVAGHKADLLFIHMRPTIAELNEIKTRFQKTKFADFTSPTYSYVSVVELSAYLAKPGVDPDTDPYLQGRLKPRLPKTAYVCFYPMNKRRQGNDNWYTLPMDQRRELMKSHGEIGRRYHGKVTQIITGSVGLDDWEWGVTLFADDPLHFKKLVYEMRFDEASARFGEFGPFYVGHRLTTEGLQQLLHLR